MLDMTTLGDDAVATKGWLKAHRFLLLRRLSQFGILALFLSGPLLGVWIVKGNLASSLTLDLLPLTDPHVLLQSMLSFDIDAVRQQLASFDELLAAMKQKAASDE
jgi:ferredoxin-type protein NapH